MSKVKLLYSNVFFEVNRLEDKERKIELYETYGKMLTTNMQDVFEQYYFSDLSLREIASNNEISFQAVRDTLKKAEKQLFDNEKIFNIKAVYNSADSVSYTTGYSGRLLYIFLQK